MTEQERLAAALEYQQAQQPAMMNPNLAAQGEKSRNRLATALASPSWSGEELPMENRATFLPFRDTMPGSVMNKRELSLPGVVAGAVNAITAPARSMETYVDDYGNVQYKFNAPQEAANVALNMMGGGMGASRNAPANVLGMFVGPRSKSWNAEANARAVQMEKAGATPEAIWQETGNYKAPDAAWRQEVSDKGSKITEAVPKAIVNSEERMFKGSLGRGFSHEELYKAYPTLQKIKANFYADINPSGSYAQNAKSMVVGAPSTGDQRSVALHEIQHAIQNREGFGRGGSVNEFASGPMFDEKARNLAAELSQVVTGGVSARPSEVITGIKYADNKQLAPIIKKYGFNSVEDAVSYLSAQDARRTPLEQYRRLAGEAEARATQRRRNLTDEQRRAEFPERSYDVPINELIIRR